MNYQGSELSISPTESHIKLKNILKSQSALQQPNIKKKKQKQTHSQNHSSLPIIHNPVIPKTNTNSVTTKEENINLPQIYLAPTLYRITPCLNQKRRKHSYNSLLNNTPHTNLILNKIISNQKKPKFNKTKDVFSRLYNRRKELKEHVIDVENKMKQTWQNRMDYLNFDTSKVCRQKIYKENYSYLVKMMKNIKTITRFLQAYNLEKKYAYLAELKKFFS